MDNFMRKARIAMEKNRFLQKLVPIIEKTGIPTKIRHFGWVITRKEAYVFPQRGLFRKEYNAHAREFEKVEAMLADEFSRKTYRTVVDYRRSFCKSKACLKKIAVYPQYFQKDIFGPAQDEVFVDGGAYIGDTIQSYAENFASGGGTPWKRVYAWEPEDMNVALLREACKKYENVTVVPCGLWSEKAVLSFSTGMNDGSRVGTGTGKVQCDAIDNVCAGDKVTFIKMDIEGSEQEALRGAQTVIKRDKPRLAICLYHKPEDFYKIPLMIKEMVPEYKLYVRHHSSRWTETVLYATL